MYVDRWIDTLHFKSIIVLHSKHELPELLADYKIIIQIITFICITAMCACIHACFYLFM